MKYLFVGLVALLSTLAVDAQTSPIHKELRQAAVNRPRRLIIDNDGNEAVTMKALTKDEFLKQRTTALAGTGVDCIYYCSNATFTLSTRPSKVWQGRDYRLSGRPGAYSVAEMKAAGLDPLKLIVDFGKANRIEVFSSIRVNDVHDHSATADYGPPMFKHNLFKQAHPDWLLGTMQKRSRTGAWSAVNFLIPEVRDKFFAYVEEACTQYDVDGINLDFFRHPVFFASTFAGKHATAEELSAMTELMTRIRRMADEAGAKRKRPILISMRVPDSIEYCRAIGLDVERWLAEDLADMLVMSGYFQLNEWSTSAALGKKYGVKVYASLDESRIKDEAGRKSRGTNEAYRGRAAAAWQAGMDGVLLFNFFDPASPLWKELGNAKKLTELDKDYFGSVRGIVGANGGNLPIGPYQKVETLNPSNPKKVAAGMELSARIMMGESGKTEKTLRLRFRAVPAELVVQVNGHVVSIKETEPDWVEARVTKELVAGINKVTVKSQSATEWMDLVVRERPTVIR